MIINDIVIIKSLNKYAFYGGKASNDIGYLCQAKNKGSYYSQLYIVDAEDIVFIGSYLNYFDYRIEFLEIDINYLVIYNEID